MKGFYKKHEDGSITRHDEIHTPGFDLTEETKGEADGYKWFDEASDAYAHFANPSVSIRAWQAKAVLSLAGYLTAAEQVIDGLPEPQRTVVMSAWANQADFARDSPTVLSLAAALGLTEAQLDGLFEQAMALTV